MTKSRLWKGCLWGFAAIACLIAIWAVLRGRSQWGERLSRTDAVIDQKSPSPDGSKLLVRYRFDSGALGYTAERDVIVPVKNLQDDLQPFTLPNRYEPVRWEKDGSLTVAVDYIECIRKNEDCSKTSDSFRGTPINIRIDDETDGKVREIEADLPSPDGHRRLIAYRYPSDDRSNLSQIHISLIGRNDEIPRYGNYYIASVEGDGILGARWESDSSVVFLTNSSQKYLLQYAESFRHNGPPIRYRVETDDSLPGYLWVKGAGSAGKNPRREQ
jgi:hypothetical protein